MSQHGEEERWVEERDRGVETGRESPHEGLRPVGRVILDPRPYFVSSWLRHTPRVSSTYRLPGVSPPSTGQQLVSVLGLDESRVLDDSARQLRE